MNRLVVALFVSILLVLAPAQAGCSITGHLGEPVPVETTIVRSDPGEVNACDPDDPQESVEPAPDEVQCFDPVDRLSVDACYELPYDQGFRLALRRFEAMFAELEEFRRSQGLNAME